MNEELQVVTQPELLAVVEKSKITRTKAEEHAAAFAPFMQDYISLSGQLKEVNKENPTETDALKAREIRLKMVKVRTGSEGIKDLRKEIIKAEDGLIMGLFNVVKNSCVITEGEALEIEKHQERIEAKRKEDLKASREALLLPYEVDLSYIVLSDMSDETFEKLLKDSKDLYDFKVEKAAKEEAERIESERIAAEKAEKERIEREAEEKRIREENERLKKEAELKEAELKAEREESARKEAEIIAKAKAEQEEKDRIAKIESDRINAEKLKAQQEQARLQAEIAAKNKADKEEKERIEAEKKSALLAPDKEKVNALYVSIRDFSIPEFSTEEAQKIGVEVRQAFEIILNDIKEAAKKLK